MRSLSIYQKIAQAFMRAGNKLVWLISRSYALESKISVLVLACIIFSLSLFYFVQRANHPFYHDSLYYWDLANSFENENFSFTNYSNELRGYLFPFLLFLLKKQAFFLGFDAKLLFHVYSALFFTILSIYIIPWFFHTIFDRRTVLWGRLLIALLVFFFWRGYFLYPLSDFPAFVSLLIGITLLLLSLRYQTVPTWVVFVGLFIGAAINIRPVYQASLFIIIPLVLIRLYKMGMPRGITWISLFLLGFSLILLPQMQINRTHFKVNSPLVLARATGNENLFMKQLFWGLETQKFESNIGDNFPSIVVVYSDPFRLNLQKTNLLREKSLTRYIKIMKRFPLEIAVSYFRHLFNGLDIFFATPYITNVYASHRFLSVVNYLVWFFVVFRLLKLELSQLAFVNVLGVMSLLAPAVLAIPTAIEVRFFLPVYLLAYGVVAFGLDYKTIIKSHLNNGWKVLRFVLVCTFWILLCFTLSNATIENLVR